MPERAQPADEGGPDQRRGKEPPGHHAARVVRADDGHEAAIRPGQEDGRGQHHVRQHRMRRDGEVPGQRQGHLKLIKVC